MEWTEKESRGRDLSVLHTAGTYTPITATYRAPAMFGTLASARVGALRETTRPGAPGTYVEWVRGQSEGTASAAKERNGRSGQGQGSIP